MVYIPLAVSYISMVSSFSSDLHINDIHTFTSDLHINGLYIFNSDLHINGLYAYLAVTYISINGQDLDTKCSDIFTKMVVT